VTSWLTERTPVHTVTRFYSSAGVLDYILLKGREKKLPWCGYLQHQPGCRSLSETTRGEKDRRKKTGTSCSYTPRKQRWPCRLHSFAKRGQTGRYAREPDPHDGKHLNRKRRRQKRANRRRNASEGRRHQSKNGGVLRAKFTKKGKKEGVVRGQRRKGAASRDAMARRRSLGPGV